MLDSPIQKQSAFTSIPSRPASTEPSILPLRATDLTLSVMGKRLVDIPELEIGSGGPTLLLGPNGAGKSILLRLLHGLIEPTTGAIHYHGRAIDNFIRRRQAMVFQRPVVLRRSVSANIDYALKAGGVRGGERRQRLVELLELGNFSRQARQAAHTLSGGEQQRLTLIRAVACRPELLFLDEPTSSLDPAATLLIEALIGQAARVGTKIVMVTHDIGQTRRLAEEIVFVHRGVVLEKTPAPQFFDGPKSRPARDFLAGQLVL